MRKNLVIWLLAMALSFFAFCVQAQATEEESSFTGSVSTSIFSGYLVDAGWLLYDRPVWQTDLYLEYSSGWYADLWVSRGLDRDEELAKAGDEVDGTLGLSTSLGEVADLDVGVSYFNCQYFEDEDGNEISGDVWDFFAKFSKDFPVGEQNVLTPSLKLEFATPVESDGPEKGVYVYAGLSHAWTISETLTFSHGIIITYDDGVYGGDSGLLGGYCAELAYALTDSVTVTPSVTMTNPLTVDDERKNEVVAGISLSYDF